MSSRILVDENLDPATADLLRERSRVAVHLEANLGEGTTETAVFASTCEHDYVVLTTDTDFLRSKRRRGFKVQYRPQNTMRALEIGGIIVELVSIIPDQYDIPPVT